MSDNLMRFLLSLRATLQERGDLCKELIVYPTAEARRHLDELRCKKEVAEELLDLLLGPVTTAH